MVSPEPHVVRQRLLPLTLRLAVEQVPYYRRVWGTKWRRVHTIGDLPRLPLLTKEQAVAHQNELLAGTPDAFVGTISSGTLGGDRPVLRVLHRAGSLEDLPGEVRQLCDQLDTGSQKRKGLLLNVRNVHHGLPQHSAGRDELRIAWAPTRNCVRLIEQLLRQRQPDGRRVDCMLIGAGALMALTAVFFESGVAAATFGLRQIGTYGFRLSDHWRRLVAEFWQVEILDNYSLSEFQSTAHECFHCGFHHWAHPPILFEVLDLHTRRQLRSGVGVLVLTGLYPFVAAMPLVRYWTGDLVRLGPFCRVAGDRGFRPLGRATTALTAPGIVGDPILISAQALQNFLEARPEVAQQPHPATLAQLVRCNDIGAVKFELGLRRHAGIQAHVRIELRFEPRFYVERVAELAKELRRYLLAQSRRLRHLVRVDPRALRIEFLPPNTIQQISAKY